MKSGDLAPCEFVNVESEFAAMSVAIGASAAGARAYTATASQGLLYMAEALYNASGLGLPIVMTVANRAIGAPINIWNDHSDAMSQRDCGWIQLYAETNQEALDLHIQAFRIAEEVSLPVMVCMDGFILTHAHERLEIPSQAQVDRFLPPYEPRQVLDPADPVSIGAMVGPEAFTEVRYLAHARQNQALRLIPEVAADFAAEFGRDSGGLVRPYRTRGRGHDRGRARLGARHHQGHDRRAAGRGRQDRRARHHLVPAVPARGRAGSASRRTAGRRAGAGPGRRHRRHRVGQRPDGAVRASSCTATRSSRASAAVPSPRRRCATCSSRPPRTAWSR